MGIKRALAGVAAAALALGGVALTTSTAVAVPVPGTTFLPVSGIIPTTDQANETANYNVWHFQPSAKTGASQATNGLLAAAGSGTRLAVIVGNGQDINAAGGLTIDAAMSAQIDIAFGDAAAAWYQIPVLFDEGFTTLRSNAGGDGSTWESSRAFPGIAANTATPKQAILDALALMTNERPIATGFFIENPAAPVIVNSFTSFGATTTFTPAPGACVANAASSNFVDAADIRANEATYPGWHNGLTKTETTKNFVTTKKGLEVTGNAQILNGLADPAEFQANCLSAAADMKVEVVESTSTVATQVPVFYYPSGDQEGVRQFTTFRLNDSAELGNTAALWTTSGAIYADDAKTVVLFEKNASAPLADFIAAIGQHDVIGFGFYVDIDESATVSSVTFNNQTTNFAKVVPTAPVKPVKVETGL